MTEQVELIGGPCNGLIIRVTQGVHSVAIPRMGGGNYNYTREVRCDRTVYTMLPPHREKANA